MLEYRQNYVGDYWIYWIDEFDPTMLVLQHGIIQTSIGDGIE